MYIALRIPDGVTVNIAGFHQKTRSILMPGSSGFDSPSGSDFLFVFVGSDCISVFLSVLATPGSCGEACGAKDGRVRLIQGQ